MKTFNFSAINLGCSKNLVDLEFMIGNIFNLSKEIKIEFSIDPFDENVEYVILNTCGFLSSSRKEAEDTIKELDEANKKIIVMGCYTEVKDDEFLSSLKNLYAVIPHNDSKNLDLIFKSPGLQKLKNKLSQKSSQKQEIGGREILSKGAYKNVSEGDNNLSDEKVLEFSEDLANYLKNIGGDNISKKAFIWQSEDQRAYLNADYGYEFLKISEGCDNNCTFCIIPNIRGRQKSRTIEDILVEVKNMISLGIKEIQIISQDSTRYGTDIYDGPKLVELLEEIDKIEGDFKFRLYYFYPDILTFSHLERLKNLKKMLPYFDIPFQHISPKILKLMGRFYDEEHIYKLLDYIKKEFKNPFIHTNFIVGFPGEMQEDFEKLKDFAKKYEFDSVSMFGYHDEVLATSSKLPNKVSDEIIKERVLELREILEEIYDKKYDERVGKIQNGYIHEISGNKLGVRPEIYAPEIDELDYIKKQNVLAGNIGIGEKIEYKF